MGNGLGHGTCSICHVGILPGWSLRAKEKKCFYKGCNGEAVALSGRGGVCREHLGRAKTGKVTLAEYIGQCIAERSRKWVLIDDGSAFRGTLEERLTEYRAARAALHLAPDESIPDFAHLVTDGKRLTVEQIRFIEIQRALSIMGGLHLVDQSPVPPAPPALPDGAELEAALAQAILEIKDKAEAEGYKVTAGAITADNVIITHMCNSLNEAYLWADKQLTDADSVLGEAAVIATIGYINSLKTRYWRFGLDNEWEN